MTAIHGGLDDEAPVNSGDRDSGIGSAPMDAASAASAASVVTGVGLEDMMFLALTAVLAVVVTLSVAIWGRSTTPTR